LDFRILGPFEIDGGSTSPLLIRGNKRRGLLAVLLVHAREPVSRERLVDDLWSDAVEGADHTIQTYVSQLRKLLSDGVGIETVGKGYRLDVPRECVDVDRFLDTAATANSVANLERRRELLNAALSLWRGSPLEEFAGMTWADATAQRLEQRRLEVLEQRIDVDLAVGRARELLGELAELTRAFPLAEPLWAQRMIALYRCGRQADALRAYSELRSILAEELGIEPSRALADLELRILDQDETLLELATAVALTTSAPARELPVGTVTFLLTDIVRSTELWDVHPEEMAAAVREHEAIIEDVITASNGHHLKHRGEGDSTLSVFDRAADALDAAIELRDRFAAEPDALTLPVTVRIALHTGEVEQRDRDYFGPVLNRAARIRALASGNEILCSRATAELVADSVPPDAALVELGSLRLRGLRRNEVVFRVVRREGATTNEPTSNAVPGVDAAPPETGVRVDLRDESSLIARDGEMDRLVELAASVELGRPGVLFLRGDAGVGKTRLVHDFVESHRDFEAHFISCTPQGASARLALADLVRSAFGSESDANRDVVMLLGERSSHDADAGADVARLQRLTILRDAIRTLARETPALLVVEDVHWAEAGFVELLEFVVADLLNQRRDLPILLVITRRTFAVPADIEAVLARLERLPGARTMTLRPMRDVDVDELVRSFGVDPPGRTLIRLLYERSRGNPLYVREALRRIADLDGFVVRSGCIETVLPPTEFGAPADLRELVALRLADVPDETLDVLALASIAGFEFDPDLVKQVGSDEVETQLNIAARAGLLAETTGGYRFTHPIIHAAVYDAVAPERRRFHHRTLAAALDRMPPEQRSNRLLELAHHLLEAGLGDAPAYVAEDLEEAGRRASALAEWAEAARCYDGAVAIAERTGAPTERVAWLSFSSGLVHERHYDAATAERNYWRALELGRKLDNRELWGRSALALAMRTSVAHSNAAIGDFDERAWQALVEALEHVGQELPQLRAEMLCKFAEMRYQSNDVPAGLAAASEAVRLAETADSSELLVFCQSNLAYGYLAAGDAASAFEALAEVRDRVDIDLNPQDQGFALARLALAYLALGHLGDGLRATHDAFVVFDAARHQSGACMAETIAADTLLRQGERKEGERHARDAARLYRISEYSQAPPILYSALVAARSIDGEMEAAEEAIDAWSATGERGQGLARALLAVRANAIDDPEALADRARRMMASASAPSIVQIGRLGALAEIASALVLPDLARDVLAAVEGRVGADVVFSPGFPFHALATKAVALDALNSPDCTAAYGDALIAVERVGAEPEARTIRARLTALGAADRGRDTS
jgi:DNA-binding SARP family transcriptional activator